MAAGKLNAYKRPISFIWTQDRDSLPANSKLLAVGYDMVSMTVRIHTMLILLWCLL